MDEIRLDDLPKYSDWPARIMGIEQFRNRVKNQSELIREYELEKWGPLWREYISSSEPKPFSVFMRECCSREKDAIVWWEGRLLKMSALENYQSLIDVVIRAIVPYINHAHVVELGAGYGRVILSLIERGIVSYDSAWAAEFAPSGIALADALAKASGWSLRTGLCDFMAKPMVRMAVPEGSVIFTAFATPCVPELPESFVTEICALRPSTVVHIEPLYEHCDTKTLLGMMQRRYIELNDYNRNLLTLLNQQASKGRIELVEISPQIFGSQPLLVASIVVWRPRAP